MVEYALRLIRRYGQVNWALADQAMVSGVNFLTGILLARYLGLQEFGRFTLAWLIVLFVSDLQHALINAPMMSIGPKQEPQNTHRYFGAVFFHQLVVAAVSFAVLASAVTVTSRLFPAWNIEGYALPLGIAACLVQIQDFLRRYFFTRRHSATAFATDAVRYGGQVALIVLFVYLASLTVTMALWIIAWTAAVATLVGMGRLRPIGWSRSMIWKVLRRHWALSRWLAGGAVLRWGTRSAFFVAAGAVLGPAAVGALKAAQNLLGALHVLFLGLENVVPARAGAEYRAGGPKALVAYLRKVLSVGGAATCVIVLLIAAFADFWLGLFYGGEYVGYGYVVQWYAAIYLLFFIGVALTSGLRALEWGRPIFFGYIVATAIAAAAAYPLARLGGLAGVVAGMLFVKVLLHAIWFIALQKKLGMRLLG